MLTRAHNPKNKRTTFHTQQQSVHRLYNNPQPLPHVDEFSEQSGEELALHQQLKEQYARLRHEQLDDKQWAMREAEERALMEIEDQESQAAAQAQYAVHA